MSGRVVAAVVVVAALVSCSSSSTQSKPTLTSTTTSAQAVPPSSIDPWCGATTVTRAAAPTWAAGSPGGVYVLSAHGDVAGFLFARPLVAPARPNGPNNKILWIVRLAREGQPLSLDGHPLSGAGAVSMSEPADSSPGEIYPSIVDVPTPGCWHFVLRWGGHTDEIDLLYEPRT